MNTSVYYKSDDILFMVLPRVNDIEFVRYPKGFYISLIQKALEELGMDTFFDERNESFDFPVENLTLKLPAGCFNVRNIYLFNGDSCNIASSIKVWWKRNYFTKGNGYTANDKYNNYSDPFYGSHGGTAFRGNKDFIRANAQDNAKYFYNIQMGNLMFSSHCRGVANKVMIHFNGTGCDLGSVPFIPVFLRTAVEDYVTVRALEGMVAKDRAWKDLLLFYNNKMTQPYEGSWDKAEQRIKSMNTSQRAELFEYLSAPNITQG